MLLHSVATKVADMATFVIAAVVRTEQAVADLAVDGHPLQVGQIYCWER